MQQTNINHKFTEKPTDFLLFTLCLLSVITNIILGDGSIFTSSLRILTVSYSSLYAGQLAIQYQHTPKFIWKRALLYFSLYLVFGAAYDILKVNKRFFQSLCDMLTTTKIPRYSELFFTVTIILICSAILTKHISIFQHNILLSCVVSVIVLFTSFFPNNLIGYPLIGVFCGCTTYRCIAILPTIGYFIIGIYSKTHNINKKIFVLYAFIISVLSLFLYETALKPLARYTFIALPICLILIFMELFVGSFKKHDFLCKIPELIISFSQKKKGYFVIYSACFFIISFFVFSVFRENSNSIIWMPDAIAQYVPKAYYFSNYIHNAVSQILQGNFNLPTYDFNLGMGNPVNLSLEPLYLIYAFFNPSDIETAYNFVTVLRYYFAGISMSIFLLYFKRNHYESLFGSIMYAFCGFALAEGVRHAHFIAPMILLPLLLIATEEIIRKKRWYILPPIVAISLLTSYYFHYMNTIAIGIYYLARFLFNKRKTLKDFFMTTVLFGSTYILGVLIGNITLTKSFASYLSSNRTGNVLITTNSILYYSKSWLKKCFSTFISLPNSPGYIMRFGFIPLAYIAVVILFLKHEKRILKFLFILFSSFCIFPFFGFALSGFSAVTNRWCYIYALLITFITVYSLPQLYDLSVRELKIIFYAILPYILFIALDRDYRTLSTMTAAVLLTLNYIIILLMNHNIKIITKPLGQSSLILLCIFSVCFNSFYQYSEGSDTTPSDFVSKGAAMAMVTKTPLKTTKYIDDDSFYRTSTSSISASTLNGSLVMGYNSISEFSSTINGANMDYSNLMGNSCSSLVRLRGFDNRSFLNALACIKYYANNSSSTGALPYGYEPIKQITENGQDYTIYKNNYALPLGYTYDTVLSENELNNYDTINRQEVLMQAAVLEDPNNTPSLATDVTISTTAKELDIVDIEFDGLEFIDDSTVYLTKPQATITLYFNGEANSETYLEFSGQYIARNEQRDSYLFATGTCGNVSQEYPILPENNAYNTHQDSYLYNWGYQEEAVNSCTLTISSIDKELSSEQPGTFTLDSFKIYSQPMDNYSNYIENLTENTLRDINITNNTITGNISLKENKLLVLSIPYQKGWTAYVDGKEVEIQKANIMYMGIPLPPGNHNIKLTYQMPGLRISLCISAIGLLIYIFALFIWRHQTKNNKHIR